MDIPAHHIKRIAYKSRVKKKVANVRNFEEISDKFNVDRVMAA
jgi:hypothetical protein